MTYQGVHKIRATSIIYHRERLTGLLTRSQRITIPIQPGSGPRQSEPKSGAKIALEGFFTLINRHQQW